MRAVELIRGQIGRRLALVIAASCALAYLCLSVPQWSQRQWGAVGTYDFVTYWSVAQLIRQGGNPYDPAALHTVRQQVGWPFDSTDQFSYPPWMLTLTLPMAYLPFELAAMSWLMLQAVLVVTGGLLLWLYFAEQEGYAWVGSCLAVGFLPTWSALNMGQISPWLLAGVVGFLWAERRQWDLAAGGALALLMIKPHITYLFWAAALWWALKSGRWRVLIGWVGALIAASGVVLLLAPTVFRDYAGAYTGAVAAPRWATPTIGTWLRMILGVERKWLQFLPSLLGGMGLLGLLWRQRGPWRWEVLAGPLLLASVITAVYGWSYDQVVLLPAVVALVAGSWAKRPLERIAVLLPLIGAQLGLASLSHWGVSDAFAIWHAPVLAGLYWWAASGARPGAETA